jgi:chemotaxis protein CheC
MMNIGELERDALCELANVGLSRAATQLSELLNDYIEMTVPAVQVVAFDQVAHALQLDPQAMIAAVWQNFSGHSEGTSILMFPSEDSKKLVHALVGPSIQGAGETDLRAIEHEAMMEIGNIIITAGMAVIADMLGQEMQMSMPGYMEAKLPEIMAQRSLEKSGQEMQVIIMFTQLKAAQREIQGRMVLLMSVSSVQILFARLHELLRGLPDEAN